MSDLVLRHLEMLKLIPRSAPGISTTELERALTAQGFKISLRSIQRDLDKLSSVFPLTCDQEGTANMWYFAFREGQQILIPGMDHRAALMLKLAESHLKPLIPQPLKSFLAPFFPEANKILGQHPSQLKNWLDKTRAISQGLQQATPIVDEQVWDAISEAILSEQQCEVCYFSHSQGEAKTYRISPLGIVIRGPVSYLLAVYEGYSDIRQMALHRFQSARLVCSSAQIPKSFDIDEYIGEGHFGVLFDDSPVKLELEVQSNVVKLLREVPLATDQAISQKSDRFNVCCTLPESWDLYKWLLSQGAGIKVLAPEHIRETYIGYLQRALEQY